ncbi:MAG: capsule assembly Wzi family protein [Mangrovibacterium sp.]
MKIFFLLALMLISSCVFSQTSSWNASVETSCLAGHGNSLPFWLTQNKLGKLSTRSNIQELTEGKLTGSVLLNNKLTFSFGTDLAILLAEKDSRFKIIEAFAGLSGRILTIRAGAFADDEMLGGLSTSNGSIVRSRNYRPYPMIRVSTSGYIPFLFAKKWLRFKAEYDEGLLRDNRIVRHPHLHHKSVSFLFLTGESFRFSIGVDHYVFWGGTQADGNKLPGSLKSYLRYILGKKGSCDFLETDQINVAGNQLGAYLITAEKDFDDYSVELRISHPFEDHSGMELDNLPDNLYSCYIRKKKTGSLLDGFLFEFLYSKKQSGSYHLISGPGKHKRGNDNYFNHGVYGTGFSYKGYSMGTPLFYPLAENEQGVISGFENNRVAAFHAAMKGCLSERLRWKIMLTCSRNYGTFNNPYSSVKKQIYSLAEISWNSKKLPLSFLGHIAADHGTLADHRYGCGFSVMWTLY